jgi:hypothetical protein
VRPRGRCPPGRRSAGGGAGHAQVVDVGRDRIVREAGLSTEVHGGVPLHELPPSKWLSSACLESEIGEVIAGEPKRLLHWVSPQHVDDCLVREASDERCASRGPHQDIGTRRPGEGTPGNRLRRPSVDDTEGAEAQGGPRGQRNPAALHPVRW